MARRATSSCTPSREPDLVWLSAITRYLLENGLAHDELPSPMVNGLEEYKKKLAHFFTMEFASQTCGLSVETLERVAHMIAEAKACVCFGRWE